MAKKHWIEAAERCLEESSDVVPHEMNELDWKVRLSEHKDRLAEHLIASANHPNGGCLVFGVADDGCPEGIDQEAVARIANTLANLGRDAVEPPIAIDHGVVEFRGVPLLFVRVPEQSVKPVHRRGKSVEEAWVRSGGTTRKASRQEVGALMLNSATPRWEDLRASALLSLDEVNAMLDLEAVATLKVETIREVCGQRGYAVGFEGLIGYLKRTLPHSEVIEQALREDVSAFPEIALRELIANALIHQDFTVTGAGPMIGIYDDRIEITNPGTLLPGKRPDRLVGTTPESRNEQLAASFRRYRICEERGTGFQKVVHATEIFGLPPLIFTPLENAFRVTLYAPRRFADMSQAERLESCYQHAVLQYLSSGTLTNTSLRERFKLHDKHRNQITNLIGEAVEAGRIKRKDAGSGKKFAEYLPYWA